MPEQIIKHYERHAHAFDNARRTRFVEKGWLDRFLLAVPRHGLILDLGCGAGEPVDRYLIDTGHELIGVDVSEKMIGLARTRFPRHIWLCADMRRTAIGRPFHGILAWDSLFHLPSGDQIAMIEKMARWLKPGGAMLFNTHPALDGTIDADLCQQPPPPYALHALFEELGLVEVAFAPDDPATHGRSIWLARKPSQPSFR